MTLLASIFIFLLTLGFTVALQMNAQSLKKKHLEKMTQLRLTAAQLLKNQNELCDKISLMDSFHNHYKDSREYLNQEILSLLHQFLRKRNEV